MMKKLFLVMLTCLMAGSLQAQSLIGTWKCVLNAEDRQDELYYIFEEDSGFYLKACYEMIHPDFGKCVIISKTPGLYDYDDDGLLIDLWNYDVQYEITFIERSKYPSVTPEMWEEMEKKIPCELKAEAERQMDKNIDNVDCEIYNVVSLTDSKLILLNLDNEEEEYTRVVND